MSDGATSHESAPPPKKRLESLDAFRGLTILGMVFVIAIAAGGYWKKVDNPLPQRMNWFGSNPVSTWFHADVGFEAWEYELAQQGLDEVAIKAHPEYEDRHARRMIGVTFTDLIAPWFVFIVGVCIPLSRSRRGGDWWWHVGLRTLMLIIAGVVYISLVIKQVTWWWGVLQAIGVAYFCGALLCRLPAGLPRWLTILAVGAFNLVMTSLFAWWTTAFEGSTAPFGTLSNPGGDWLKPWIVHCLPWLSISYGVMTMIGVLIGEALVTRNDRLIMMRCLVVGGVFTILGYAIHKAGFITGRLELCFNKPDVSSSYAFFSAGVGALVFAGFYWIIDVVGFKAWAWPLTVFGANPLLAYFMMIIQRRVLESLGLIGPFNLIQDNAFIQNWAALFGSVEEPSRAVLAFFDKGGYMGVFWGLVYTFILWLIVLWCNKRKLYWKF